MEKYTTDQYKSNLELIKFINKYNLLLERQLFTVKGQLDNIVNTVMVRVRQLSDQTEQTKKSVDRELENTYLNPDQKTREFMDSMQNSVSEIFEKAQNNNTEALKQSSINSEEIQDKLIKFRSKLSNSDADLKKIDLELEKVLFDMIEALSRDDIIAQRLEHANMCLNALSTSLAGILLDFSAKCNEVEIEKFKQDLKNFTFKTYSMEEERALFKEVFPS